MAAYANPIKEESEKLRGERDQIKFIELIIVFCRKAIARSTQLVIRDLLCSIDFLPP